ncbi:hypothetical protein [Streptomyces umbrinus]|uniref:hypothetical protein n=1 Tax=Streptomyces umbrinus TaxID=67370 RepID=UPI0033FE1FDB
MTDTDPERGEGTVTADAAMTLTRPTRARASSMVTWNVTGKTAQNAPTGHGWADKGQRDAAT